MRLTENEYKQLRKSSKTPIRNPRKTRALCSNNPKAKVVRQKLSSVSSLFEVSSGLLFGGNFKIEVEIYGKSRADGDNILKGILDALQGVAYDNDRRCREGSFRFC